MLQPHALQPHALQPHALRPHALRPHALDGHLALYKAALHHSGNRLPRWWLELIGVAVSNWNACAYCVAHRGVGLARLVGDARRGAERP